MTEAEVSRYLRRAVRRREYLSLAREIAIAIVMLASAVTVISAIGG